jgi:hypothetical protein
MEVLEINKNLKKPKKLVCEICDFITSRNQDYEMHLVTAKHKRKLLETNQNLNMPSVGFHCNECNYTTLKKNLFEKHQNSIKHTRNMNKEPTENKHICDVCNKEYLNSSGLWKHKKICQVLENKTEVLESNPEVLETKKELTNQLREPDMKTPMLTVELFMDLMKQNKDLQNCLMESHNKIVELSKTSGTVNTNCNNNNNNQFNLQFFLNETCKNAMNITDFVNSLQLTSQDFENTGKLGYVDGITKIIINKLNSVDTTVRPIHCTDVKRETLYIKDENVWEKEDEHKTKFKKVINQIANKNLNQINKWKDEHPDCINLDTNDNIAFRKYYKVALGGDTHEDDDKLADKIKRNVLKEILVDKYREPTVFSNANAL